MSARTRQGRDLARVVAAVCVLALLSAAGLWWVLFDVGGTHVTAYFTKTVGVYQCRACGAELFRSDTKFDSHCGWPSFWSPLAGDSVILREDRAMGMVRVEVLCATCLSHLGHVFEGEGYGTPTDQRYCINSISLKLIPAEG